MKIASGDFNGNGYADLAILHQRSDGGADVHVLYGGPGSSPLGNTTTITRSLPSADGWDWTKMKVTAGDYNGDHFSDLAILHQTSDGGSDVHLLFGGTSPLSNTTTWLRSLPAASGWNWSQMMVESGDYNGNTYADLAILHQRTDGGADVHVLYGGPGTSPLGNTTTITRSLPGTSGWDWTKMLLAPAS
ncbi:MULTISPECIES: VCBS repeat-containing protein [Streptacidiphilus]|uniref:FG-GAP repeat domain-containing protein n=1 Tax=Streptacidiphilus cavernicola TaxID=3342716 RepID=A0ABV6ULV2_9ACTN|nr:VCBS repeat-containing protein [Streptacidiphilus jeojiense]